MNMWMKNKTLPLLLSAVLVVSMGGGVFRSMPQVAQMDSGKRKR